MWKSLQRYMPSVLEKQSIISVCVISDEPLSDARSAEKEPGGVTFFQIALCPAKPWKFSENKREANK